MNSMTMQKLELICCILLLSSITISKCSFSERVVKFPDCLRIRYEHQVHDGTYDFTQTVHTKQFENITSVSCSKTDNEYCLEWGKLARFQITPVNKYCELFDYNTITADPLWISFDVAKIHLYGGSEIDNQTWPIKTTDVKLEPFISKERNSESILESIWFTDNGFFVKLEDSVPLFLSIVNNELNFIAERRDPYIRAGNVTVLKFMVCKYDDIKIAYKNAIDNVLGKPTAVPDYKMVQYPIWSTWAKYKADVNESAVLEYVDSLDYYKLPNSHIEIDDRWETCYGSLTVDTDRFPNMTDLVQKLHKRNYRVTVWVHPFVNEDCQPFFDEGKEKNYFVLNKNGSVSGKWWNGIGASIDFTNPAAVEWYRRRLRKIIEETGIDALKFDAGESTWAPQVPVFHKLESYHPETIKNYVQVAATFGPMVEVRAARQTQTHPIFVRMIDRETAWKGRLSLDTVIPELLHMNIIGYPFVLPDMIGGNQYAQVLTKELYIRWLQTSVFMPSLQFSVPPWDFDNETIALTLKYIQLHANFAPKIYEEMKKSVKHGTMVNPPLWWLDPTDSMALTIKSEFLLGEDVLVAPVLEQGATQRDIYFPRGVWQDETYKNEALITGPTWRRNYPASLDVLPYFTRISAGASFLSPSLFVLIIVLFSSLWI